MKRNPRYDVLFEPVQIGPVRAKNRFYQVPHSSSTSNELPHTRAAFRAARAEGGWGVICTGCCSIHPSSEDLPLRLARLWDDDDVRNLAPMTEAVHAHGALAGVELFHGGGRSSNRFTRMMPLSPSGLPHFTSHSFKQYPLHTRCMDKADIRQLRGWQVEAAKRARSAGFDIVYIYAGMGFGPSQFLSRNTNQRTDEYGGPIENRVRLLREMIEDTLEAVGDKCAVAVRLSTDELMGPMGLQWENEGKAIFELIGDLPDLWDLKTWGYRDGSNSRYSQEGYQEPYVAFAKAMTTKPVVGVGRFTSPDAMVSQVKRNVLDLIGAARPSIADPFLPLKLEEGREDDIRECIGCNICFACAYEGVPVRCTQNPTAGEEGRRGWHPERIQASASNDAVLIVGGGPAGLEAARALGQRGYEITLADANLKLGGRLLHESLLPGLGTWIRVRDWRVSQIQKMANVSVYLDSSLSVEQIFEFGFSRVVLATGSAWSQDLFSPQMAPIAVADTASILTPDDVLAGKEVGGKVIIFDFDYYFMGSCLAEQLAMAGHEIIFVTPGDEVSGWSRNTLDQAYAQMRLLELGVKIITARFVTCFDGINAITVCKYTGREESIAAESMIVVGTRRPNDNLYQGLINSSGALEDAGIGSVQKIGDCDVPGAVVHAVYAGHMLAREFDGQSTSHSPFKSERPLSPAGC